MEKQRVILKEKGKDLQDSQKSILNGRWVIIIPSYVNTIKKGKMIKYALMSLAFPMENIPIEVPGMLTFTEFEQSVPERAKNQRNSRHCY